jgi:hypothetical protein
MKVLTRYDIPPDSIHVLNIIRSNDFKTGEIYSTFIKSPRPRPLQGISDTCSKYNRRIYAVSHIEWDQLVREPSRAQSGMPSFPYYGANKSKIWLLPFHQNAKSTRSVIGRLMSRLHVPFISML